MGLGLINENHNDMITTKSYYDMHNYVNIRIEFNFPFDISSKIWKEYGMENLFIEAYPIIFDAEKHKDILLDSSALFNNKYDNLKLLLLLNADWAMLLQQIYENSIKNYAYEKRIINLKDLKDEVKNAKLRIANKLQEVLHDNEHDRGYYLSKIHTSVNNNMFLYDGK